MKLIITMVFAVLFLQTIHAQETYLELPNGDTVYTKYSPPKKNKPIFVLINGLIYTADGWNESAEELINQGYGVLQYEFSGQNRSFSQTMESRGRGAKFLRELSLKGLAEELALILDFYNIGKKVNIVGLSYGSTIATEFTQRFPQRVNKLIYLAPLVITLEKYDPKGAMFQMWLDSLSLWGPFASMYADQLYDMIYANYFAGVEAKVDYGPHTNQFRKALLQQVKSVRDFDLRSIDLPEGIEVSLITADRETPNIYADQLKFWDNLQAASKGTRLHLENTDHAIPSSNPIATAISLQNISKRKGDCAAIILSLLKNI